ncbi:hypothetical protein C8Q79DRAFT_944937 [Trametes meyenii]|nr:hypothetical protein C8Q79DRAFT_944937 [Trametes meyenii]
MSSTDVPALFQPIRVGDMQLAHRIVLAPMARYRAGDGHVHTRMGVEYYEQRASVPGTLLITEASFISPQAGGIPNVPGIWNDDQIENYSSATQITGAVHAKGSYIFLQLWALGRAARPALLHQENPDFPYVSASAIPLSTSPDAVPRERVEIKQYVEWYATAAANAVRKAGFDGVEVHGVSGYLVDQFLQDVSNKRTDEYGGSIENRARFALEVVGARSVRSTGQRPYFILAAISCMRAVDMRMDNAEAQFSYLVEQLKQKYPDLAYVHSVTSAGPFGKGPKDPEVSVECLYHRNDAAVL